MFSFVPLQSTMFHHHLSNEKRAPGRLGYIGIGDYTIQLDGDYDKPWNKDPYWTTSIMESKVGFFSRLIWENMFYLSIKDSQIQVASREFSSPLWGYDVACWLDPFGISPQGCGSVGLGTGKNDERWRVGWSQGCLSVVGCVVGGGDAFTLGGIPHPLTVK